MADNNGNIGYTMLVPVPNRNSSTPFIGNRVLDGEKSTFDWKGLLP